MNFNNTAVDLNQKPNTLSMMYTS